MKTKKFTLSCLLVFCFVVGLMLPAIAYAETVEKESYSFNPETGELHIKNDAGSTAWRDDPNIAKEDVKSVTFQRLNTPVLNLGESAFEGCVNLTGTIKLNANATSIGANAFKGCDKIDLILIPEAAEADIAAAGISEEIPYVVYQYDIDTDAANFFIQDVHYGSKSQITFDGNIFDGTWSCGVELVCEDKFNVVPESGETAWYYHTEDDGEITVTKYLTNPVFRDTITLPEKFGDLIVKQYADDAFSHTGLTAENIIVVDEGIKATIPAEVSKMILTTENGTKVAYLTPGTSGTLDAERIFLPLHTIDTLFAKDIVISSTHGMMGCTVVSYKEDANGKISVTNVLFDNSMRDEYTVPDTIENKPVTAVMINSKYNDEMDKIVVDESMNKIVYEWDPYGSANPPVITQIAQGSEQTGVEIPAEIAGQSIGEVPATAFDQSVENIVVSEAVSVTQPENVCKIVYTTGAGGEAIITEIVPGTDGEGNIKKVVIPESIGGKAPILSEEVKDELASIPHDHLGGKATCIDKAICEICKQPYGEVEQTAHTNLTHVERKEATHLVNGNIEYWHCDGCDKCFSDAAGTQKMDLTDTVIPKLTEHTADGTGWHSNESGHWNTCECGAKMNEAAHTFEWIADEERALTKAGSKHEKCIICGYVKTVADTSTGDTAAPETGDESNTALWLTAMLAAGAFLVVTAIYNRKKEGYGR